MFRVSFFCILFLIVNLKLFAQDKIYLKNGDILDVETVGRSDTDIEYEIPGSGGQTKYLRLGRIEKIIYKSGNEEVINFDITERIGQNSLWIVPLTSAYFNLNNASSSNLDKNRFEILGFSASIEIPINKNQALEINPLSSWGREKKCCFSGKFYRDLVDINYFYSELAYKFYFFPFNAHTAKTQNMYVGPLFGLQRALFVLGFDGFDVSDRTFKNDFFVGLKSGVNFIFTPELGIRVEGKVIQLRTTVPGGSVDHVRFSLSVGPVIKF